MSGVEESSAGACACVVCGVPLTGKQTRYCSKECTKSEKRRKTRASRPARDHACQCATCGKEMRSGRPRLDDTNLAREFVQAEGSTKRAA